MDLNLKNKTAIVTGGGKGLGKAVCESLAKEGVNVALCYRSNSMEVQDFINYLNHTYSCKCCAFSLHLESRKSIEEMFLSVLDTYQTVDILINNAGIWPKSYVCDMDPEEFSHTISVNLEAPFLTCKKMVNHLIETGRKGKILNVTSQAAFHGSTTGHAHYAASKGGLVSFTVSLAREVASYGINVNAIAPGIMETPMLKNSLSTREGQDYYTKRIPLGRISTPEEIADIVTFLVSEKADYITGATIDVSGGMLMR